MEIRVRLFAMQRQQLGWRERPLEVRRRRDDRGRVAGAVATYPVLAPAASSIRFARNGAYADVDRPARQTATSWRSSRRWRVVRRESYRRIELWPDPFPDALLGELRRAVSSAADGAVVVFLGQTRESAGTPAPGQEAVAARSPVSRSRSSSYEAFDTMALAVLATIADEIEARFGVRRLAILHRTGEVPLGEASVLIAVAAEHRAAAFDACRYAIDELKARAPIWKQERFADGQVWIGQPPRAGPVER